MFTSAPKWEPVKGDNRYEQKIIEKSDGSITRITRPAGQSGEYPHHTEYYDSKGNKQNWEGSNRWDAHHSPSSSEHRGAHRVPDVGGSSTKSSGCYIATATLKCGGSESQLDFLRNWRDEVMQATGVGRSLETFYDMTGPIVASEVARNSALAKTFLYPFVKPAVWLAEQRQRNQVVAPLCDALIYLVFLTGLVYGSAVYLVCKK